MSEDAQDSSGTAKPATNPEVRTFLWFALGHGLFAAALLPAMTAALFLGNVLITPLFALPYLIATRRERLWMKLLAMVPGFTAIHYYAQYLTMQQLFPAGSSLGDPHTLSSLLPGAVGGLAGGAASLLLCALLRLTKPGPNTAAWIAGGTVALGVAGSLGVYGYFAVVDHTGMLLALLTIYTPWQLLFGAVLAKVLR